jgi:hypothetical protein
MNDENIKRIPIKNLRQEEGAIELASLFPKALVGTDEMERLMNQGIAMAKQEV